MPWNKNNKIMSIKERENNLNTQPEAKNIETEKTIKETEKERQERLEALEILEQEIRNKWPRGMPHDIWWGIAHKRMDINIDYQETIKPYLSKQELEKKEEEERQKLNEKDLKIREYTKRLREI